MVLSYKIAVLTELFPGKMSNSLADLGQRVRKNSRVRRDQDSWGSPMQRSSTG